MLKSKKISKKNTQPARSGTAFLFSAPLVTLGGAAIIVGAVFLAYLPSIGGGFVLDDDLMVTENKIIEASDGLYRLWCTTEEQDYWPLTYSTFWIEWRLWGRNPMGYHLLNMILHITEALLIWLILRKLSVPGAYLAALIFAVHPVNVESVAWIAQRKNTLSMLFFLLSILWYLKHIKRARRPFYEWCPLAAKQTTLAAEQTPPTAHCPPHTFLSFILHPSSFWYWLSLVAFVLAMLSKGSVAILPVLLLMIVWWLRSTGTVPIFADHASMVPGKLGLSPYISQWDLLKTAPFFLVAVVLAGVNVWFQTKGSGEVFRPAGFAERLLGAGGVIWFYLYKAFFPLDLAFVYAKWHIHPGSPLWWTPLLAALVVTAVLWQYRKTWSRPLLFAWGFFCTALVPVLGFTDVGFMKYSLVADRYQHIAIIGAIALATAGWSLWRWRVRDRLYWMAPAVGISAVLAFIFLTWQQNKYYRDEITLYEVTLKKNPDCWLAQNNLGFILAQIGKTGEAIEHFRQAVRINPEFPVAQNNLGSLLLRAGQLKEAMEHLQIAVDKKPNYPEAQCNLGAALVQSGRPEEAIEHYRQAVVHNPAYVDAHNNLGVALAQIGKVDEAIKHYQQALRLKPGNTEAYTNLGIVLGKTGRLEEAIESFKQALRFNPNLLDAHVNLGVALIQAGRLQEAIEHYKTALRIKSDHFEVHNNLGSALLQTGQVQEAIEHFRQAVRLKPDYIKAYNNLALAYARINQHDEAVAAARSSLELARAQGKIALAKEIEDWLNSYQEKTTP